jgi:hypothetical protein
MQKSGVLVTWNKESSKNDDAWLGISMKVYIGEILLIGTKRHLETCLDGAHMPPRHAPWHFHVGLA